MFFKVLIRWYRHRLPRPIYWIFALNLSHLWNRNKENSEENNIRFLTSIFCSFYCETNKSKICCFPQNNEACVRNYYVKENNTQATQRLNFWAISSWHHLLKYIVSWVSINAFSKEHKVNIFGCILQCRHTENFAAEERDLISSRELVEDSPASPCFKRDHCLKRGGTRGLKQRAR